MAKLLYQGHGSFRVESDDGTAVVYVDPYAGEGYDKPADIILVTHQHHDHNRTDLVTKKRRCEIIQNTDAYIDGEYKRYILNDVDIKAVPAYNKNHSRDECVGYVIEIDGVRIYFAGDTSKTAEMQDLAQMRIDYALLPIDGIYNMGPAEAAECSFIIGAAHSIPVHMKPGELFDRKTAESFKGLNPLIVEAGDAVALKSSANFN